MDAVPGAVETPLAAFRKLLGEGRVLYAAGLRNSRDREHEGFAAAVDAPAAPTLRCCFWAKSSSFPARPDRGRFWTCRARTRAGGCGPRGRQAHSGGDYGRPPTHVSRCGGKGRCDPLRLASRHDGRSGDRETSARAGVPSGRLPITFPRTVGQVPIYYSELSTGRPRRKRNSEFRWAIRRSRRATPRSTWMWTSPRSTRLGSGSLTCASNTPKAQSRPPCLAPIGPSRYRPR